MLGEYKYDAWGNILSQGGSELLTINPFRYRGYYYDTETGLYYLNSRYYDPETGRFISPDDVDVLSDTLTQPNGLNLYAYCYNNPVMMTDPDGAFTLTWWQKLLIGLAFIVLGAIATAISGGSFMAAFVCGLTYAAKSAVSGAIMGAVLGCLTSAFRGENALEGLRQGFVDGFADGFMWGGITAGLSNVVKPGSFCFIAGTKVLTDHGHKNIEDIEVGDLVLAYDEETGETAYKPVVQLFRNTTKEWCTVSVRGNDGELYEITSTPGHKYFVPGNRVRKDSRALEHASYVGLSEKWVSACDLKRGDKFLLSDGTLCEVEVVSCKKLSAPETTYNLEVADFHTYYVSDACVLVHNECWGTTRRKYWKQQAKNPINTGKYEISSFNIDRMAKGKAPIGYDGRSVELHHIFGKSKDMNSFVQLTRSEHIAFHKTYGYKVFPNIFGGG